MCRICCLALPVCHVFILKLTFIYIYSRTPAKRPPPPGAAGRSGFYKEYAMVTGNNFWKYGLAIGAGVAIGAAGAVLLSRGKIDLKKTAAAVMSHGMDLKEQAVSMMENAKENFSG